VKNVPKLNLNPKLILGLFWVGLGLVLAGLSASIVAGVWSPVALGLVLGGLVLIVLWLGLGWLNAADSALPWWRQRSMQVGTNALLTTLAVVAILGGINFLAVRMPGQIDLTEVQQFSLAPQTKQVLKTLKQPVKLMLFTTEPKQSQNQGLLEQYQRQNPDRFSFEIIDPRAQPGLAQKYNIRTSGEVVLETEGRTRTVEGGLSEPNLTPALSALVGNRKVNAYVIQGHGEAPLSGGEGNLDAAVTELKKRDFNVNVLNLLEQKQIPEDANILIIAGPKRPFLPAEVKLVQDYLAKGKPLFLMLDPGPDPTKLAMGLDPILKDWGIQLDGRIVVDASGSGQLLGLGPAYPLVLQYGSHPITKDFGQSPSYFPLAQTITVKPPSPDVQVTELVQSGTESWAEGDPQQENLNFNAARDQRGPLTLGVALSRPFKANVAKDAKADAKAKPTAEAKLVVMGDSDFATVANPQVLNSDLFLNAATWLAGGPDDSLSIRPKEAKDRRLEMTPTNWRILSLVGLGALPILAFGSATYLWWKRR
jgi:ABC-type uncharacterized transport system involved in gliding motility auxiliary subunit